jgi:hypothetical protein
MFRSLALLTVMLLISCSPKELPTIFTIDGSQVYMKVSHKTTRGELEDIRQKLTEIGIIMSYEGSEFFENNNLRRLVLTVSTPEGNSGKTTADIVALQFLYFGFVYKKGEKGSFKIGEV